MIASGYHIDSLYYTSGTPVPFLDDVLPMIRTCDLTALWHLEIMDLEWVKLSAESRRALFELCRPIISLSLSYVRQRQGLSSSELVELLNGVAEVSSPRTAVHLNPLPNRHWYAPSDNIPPPPTKALLPLKSFTLDRYCVTLVLPQLLAVFTVPLITNLAFRVMLGPDDIGHVVSLLRGCASKSESLRLGFNDLFLGLIETEDDESISKRTCVSLLSQFTLHSCIALPSALFLDQGGLSGLPALRSVHLTADPRRLPAILQPLSTCEHLTDRPPRPYCTAATWMRSRTAC